MNTQIIRKDGRKMHPMYLFEVKRPAEFKGPWDYYKLLETVPAAERRRLQSLILVIGSSPVQANFGDSAELGRY